MENLVLCQDILYLFHRNKLKFRKLQINFAKETFQELSNYCSWSLISAKPILETSLKSKVFYFPDEKKDISMSKI